MNKEELRAALKTPYFGRDRKTEIIRQAAENWLMVEDNSDIVWKAVMSYTQDCYSYHKDDEKGIKSEMLEEALRKAGLGD